MVKISKSYKNRALITYLDKKGNEWTEGDIVENLNIYGFFAGGYKTKGGILALYQGEFRFWGINLKNKIVPLAYGGGSSTKPTEYSFKKKTAQSLTKKGNMLDTNINFEKCLGLTKEESINFFEELLEI